MAWNVTRAYVASTGAAVRVGIQKIGSGNPRVMISIGKDLLRKLGDPDSCDVFVGDGDETGQLLIQCADGGEHTFQGCNNGGATLRLNAIAGMPQTKMRRTGVRFDQGEGENGEKLLTVFLPW